MYDPKHRQHILKNSLGVPYHVYLEQGRGLCIRMLSENKIWSRGYVLDKSAVDDFAAVLDKNDIIHFFYQTRDGKLMYGHGMHGQIEFRPVLESREPTPWPKYVSLMVIERTVILFYVLRYHDRYMLSMQTINDGKLSKPVVVDYIEGTSYAAVPDRDGKCHLFYPGSDRAVKHLYHRILNDDFSTFELTRKVYSTVDNIGFISAVLTEANKIHIAFEVSGDDFHEIMHMDLSAGGKPGTLYRSQTAPGFFGLIYNSGIILFFRVTDEDIYLRKSENGGTTWSDEEPYPFANNIVCFSYSSNHSRDKGIFAGEIPGNFTRGYQLAFINEEKSKPVSREMPTINNRADLSHDCMEREITLLKNLFRAMQKELTKLWITQKNLEKELAYLSRSYSELLERIELNAVYDTDKKPPSASADNISETAQTEDIFPENP